MSNEQKRGLEFLAQYEWAKWKKRQMEAMSTSNNSTHHSEKMMESLYSEKRDQLASLLFKKTGLSHCFSSITEEIEEHFEGLYTRQNNDDDDDSLANYGGNVYCGYSIVEKGKFCYLLDKELSEAEKKFLLRLIEDNSLAISIFRSSFGRQEWTFVMTIPFVLNKLDSETFELVFRISPSYHSAPYVIESYSRSDVTEDQISKTLTMYSLQI